ncbi:ATP-binding protein [Mucilaginibacter antarcticus]|uniref:histidine kinase n=2 Tax=Mucilaginibacter antarcticus TaxID=1855725 RepID=A0ABW5XT25_9SPHI
MIENTFGKNIVPDNDAERLIALKRYRIMDTPSEESFDNIAKLASEIFNVPISLLSLVDADRVFFKSNVGMGKAKEANRGHSLCALAILDERVTVFEDALKEPCLIANPNVAGDFGLGFYAGAPLITHDGFMIGTLCVIDKQPRLFSKQDEKILAGLARAAMDQVELRLSALTEINKQQVANDDLTQQREETEAINDELTTINEDLRQSQATVNSIMDEAAAINEELNAANKELHSSQEHLVKANESLMESESRFRNLITQAPVAIATLGGRKLIVSSANQMILDIWGKSAAIIGQPLHVALPELEGQPFLEILDNVFTSGQPFYGNEVKVSLIQEGTLRDCYINFVYHPIKGDNDTTRDIMVVATDVTTHVEARLQLEAAEQRFRMISDNIAQLAWMANAEGSIFWYNKRWFDFTGTTLEEMQGGGWQRVHHPDHLDRVAEKIARHFKSGEDWEDVFPLLGTNGKYRWFLSRAVPIKNAEGEILNWFGTNTDITEQHSLEQRKDEFLSIASHELKTPITSLKASLQLLDRMKNQPALPMQAKLIDQANRSMDKMGVLIDELLNVNRLTEGQLPLDKTTFTIAEMLNLCCNHVRVEGQHELILQGDDKLQIYADEHRIDQVVVNFVNNAVKYAPSSKNIYLIVEKIDNKAKVSVRDTGPGVAPEKIPFLFDRYYRADHSSKNYSGLGLGLYISAEIVKRHGGEIGVDSELGKGSTFWFTLPITA